MALTLSLLRRFELHLLVLRTYQPRKRGKPAPKLHRHPFRKDDLLEDSQKLRDTGHTTAAAMTARVEIERLLTVLALTRDDFGDEWRGIQRTASWLNDQNVIRNKTYKIVLEAAAVGNIAAHGGEVVATSLDTMYGAISSLRHTLRRKGVAGWEKGGVA
ncbi:hypothetical protein [Lacipirellula sp.]|uniref:hypothetical protein n=1 Tax=Lacipirellula sp. TaxID=2691419 RepID=UPI003D151E2E